MNTTKNKKSTDKHLQSMRSTFKQEMQGNSLGRAQGVPDLHANSDPLLELKAQKNLRTKSAGKKPQAVSISPKKQRPTTKGG